MMALLILGMVFTATKGLDGQNLVIFYAQLVGALVIIAYSTIKDRKNIKSQKKK
jgi:hypothetical protein